LCFLAQQSTFFGYVSLTELFIYLHAIIFLFYVSIRGKLVLNSYVALFVAIMLFSFVGFLINNLSDSPASFKYQVRWLNYFLVFLLTINYVKASNLKYLIKGLYLATWLVCIYGIIQTVFFTVHDKDYLLDRQLSKLHTPDL
jgi:hypothetical protein